MEGSEKNCFRVAAALLFVALIGLGVAFFFQQSDQFYYGGEPIAHVGNDARSCANTMSELLRADFLAQRSLMSKLYAPGSFRATVLDFEFQLCGGNGTDPGTSADAISVQTAERAFHTALFRGNPGAVPVLSYFSLGALPLSRRSVEIPWCIPRAAKCDSDDGRIGLGLFALDFPTVLSLAVERPTHLAFVEQFRNGTRPLRYVVKTADGPRFFSIGSVTHWMRLAISMWVLIVPFGLLFAGLAVYETVDILSVRLVLRSGRILLRPNVLRKNASNLRRKYFARGWGDNRGLQSFMGLAVLILWVYVPPFVNYSSGSPGVQASFSLQVGVGLLFLMVTVKWRTWGDLSTLIIFANVLIAALLTVPLVLVGLVQDWDNAANPVVRVFLGCAYFYRIYMTPVENGRIPALWEEKTCQELLGLRYSALVHHRWTAGIHVHKIQEVQFAPHLVEFTDRRASTGERAAKLYLEPVLWLIFVIGLQSVTDRVEVYASNIWAAVLTLSVISVRLWPQLGEVARRNEFLNQIAVTKDADGFISEFRTEQATTFIEQFSAGSCSPCPSTRTSSTASTRVSSRTLAWARCRSSTTAHLQRTTQPRLN
eukprot:TRINITY_DN3050_c0_g1_i2.p1 TRINITY_DN3050_c0_g1~~TRINITY_DN3050_c0_g1_i2.p1  ORF type:complete len:673 (+),score=-23.87 TRINITY_DN3050_c0_g1_i2:229-2019(+)